MTRLLRALAIARGVLRARRDPRPDLGAEPPPTERDVVSTPRSEAAVAALLVLATLLFVAFAVLVVADPNTQLLGGALGGGLAALAGALLLAAARVVPDETAEEERPPLPTPRRETDEVRGEIASVGDGVSRRRLLLGTAGAAGAGLTAAVAVPALTALGPNLGAENHRSPWRRGVPLVDEEGVAIRADAIAPGSFITALPEGADPRELGSPVVVVQVDPATLQLPPERRGWAPRGLLAFSKICTHAGCAVSLYRSPQYEPTTDRPALICPCHYSTFDVRRGADVVFGPAGRPLPQLPLAIDAQGRLIAAGGFSGSVGPAWWGTRRDD